MFTTKELNRLLSAAPKAPRPAPTPRAATKQAAAVTVAPKKKPAPPPQSPTAPEDPDYVPIGVHGLIGATEKLLAVNRGLTEPDDRDSYGFKRIYSVDKHLGERVRLDAGKVRNRMVRTAAKFRSLKGAYPLAFEPYTKGLIIGDPGDANPLSSPLEEINPLHILEQARRITQMGTGGILSSQSITENAQNVNPSQFGFVSPIAGPECLPGYMEVSTARGWIQWSEVLDDDLFATRVDAGVQYNKASRVVREPFYGELICFNDGLVAFAVTGNHRMIYKRLDDDEERWAYAERLYGQLVRLPLGLERQFTDTTRIDRSPTWSRIPYRGLVYCATVPGGELLIRRDGTQAVWTGNSEKIGVDARLAHGVRIGSDGKLYQQFKNARTGHLEWKTPDEMENSVLRVPD